MGERVSGGAAHVLIVDDHEDVRRGLSRLLRSAGMCVCCADGGAAALEHLKQALPDLVLLDVSMPEMDGFEVLRRIRAEARTADLPVVMLTAIRDEQLRERAVAAGANDLLFKMPSDLASLPTRLMGYVRR